MLSSCGDIIRKQSPADYVHIVDEETASNAAKSIFNAIKFDAPNDIAHSNAKEKSSPEIKVTTNGIEVDDCSRIKANKTFAPPVINATELVGNSSETEKSRSAVNVSAVTVDDGNCTKVKATKTFSPPVISSTEVAEISAIPKKSSSTANNGEGNEKCLSKTKRNKPLLPPMSPAIEKTNISNPVASECNERVAAPSKPSFKQVGTDTSMNAVMQTTNNVVHVLHPTERIVGNHSPERRWVNIAPKLPNTDSPKKILDIKEVSNGNPGPSKSPENTVSSAPLSKGVKKSESVCNKPKLGSASEENNTKAASATVVRRKRWIDIAPKSDTTKKPRNDSSDGTDVSIIKDVDVKNVTLSENNGKTTRSNLTVPKRCSTRQYESSLSKSKSPIKGAKMQILSIEPVKDDKSKKEIHEDSKNSKLLTISKEGKNRLKRAFQGILAPKNVTIKCQDIGKTLERIPLEEIVDQDSSYRKKLRSSLRRNTRSTSVPSLTAAEAGANNSEPAPKPTDVNISVENETKIDPSKLVIDREKLKKFNTVLSKYKGIKSITSKTMSANVEVGSPGTSTSVPRKVPNPKRKPQKTSHNASNLPNSSIMYNLPECKEHPYCNKRLKAFMKEKGNALQELKKLDHKTVHGRNIQIRNNLNTSSSVTEMKKGAPSGQAKSSANTSYNVVTQKSSKQSVHTRLSPAVTNTTMPISAPALKLPISRSQASAPALKLPISRVQASYPAPLPKQTSIGSISINNVNSDMLNKVMVVGNNLIFPGALPGTTLWKQTIPASSPAAQHPLTPSCSSEQVVMHPISTSATPNMTSPASTIIKSGSVIQTLVPLNSNPHLLNKPNSHFYVKNKDGLYVRVNTPYFRQSLSQQVLNAKEIDASDTSFPKIISVKSIQKSAAEVRQAPLSVKTHIPTHHTVENPNVSTTQQNIPSVQLDSQSKPWKSKQLPFSFIPSRRDRQFQSLIGLEVIAQRMHENVENHEPEIS